MQTAKIFKHGGSQAVRLPAEFRFDEKEVYVWRDEVTGNVVLSTHASATWSGFLAERDRLRAQAPEEFAGFMSERRDAPAEARGVFDDWKE